jgi:hypothetical protein
MMVPSRLTNEFLPNRRNPKRKRIPNRFPSKDPNRIDQGYSCDGFHGAESSDVTRIVSKPKIS